MYRVYKATSFVERMNVITKALIKGFQPDDCSEDIFDVENFECRPYVYVEEENLEIGVGEDPADNLDEDEFIRVNSHTKLLDIPKTKILVRLNSDYNAEVNSERIKVGCQTFTLATFDKLAEAVATVRANATKGE